MTEKDREISEHWDANSNNVYYCLMYYRRSSIERRIAGRKVRVLKSAAVLKDKDAQEQRRQAAKTQCCWRGRCSGASYLDIDMDGTKRLLRIYSDKSMISNKMPKIVGGVRMKVVTHT